MLMLERFELSALVRLAAPSRDKSSADRIWTFPGTLSTSMVAPGIAVAVIVTVWSDASLDPSARTDGLRKSAEPLHIISARAWR